MTPEAFCWPYASGCLDTRLIEHKISDEDHKYAMECLDKHITPPDEFIRRVFPRPFEILGEDCTLADMKHYWRVTHQAKTEKSPVHVATLVPYGHRTYPVEDNGKWWYARYYDEKIQDLSKVLVKNVHNLHIQPGMRAYIHGVIIAEIAE